MVTIRPAVPEDDLNISVLVVNAFRQPNESNLIRSLRARGEIAIELADEDEGRLKSHLLALYRSEAFNLRNVGGGNAPFRESFRPLPRHDYTRPPHSGRLFYERFHWVPFPVPAINRTTGADVSTAIAAFLSGAGAASR